VIPYTLTLTEDNKVDGVDKEKPGKIILDELDAEDNNHDSSSSDD
jgi:hypothetical protein